MKLASIDEEALGEEIEFLWELEPVIERADMPTLSALDDPSTLEALRDVVRWGAATKADRGYLQAPFRSGATIEDYQLDPVRAIDMARTNLLIADDVGVGKTIEAGLVIQEMLLRHRARTILVRDDGEVRVGRGDCRDVVIMVSVVASGEVAHRDGREVRSRVPHRPTPSWPSPRDEIAACTPRRHPQGKARSPPRYPRGRDQGSQDQDFQDQDLGRRPGERGQHTEDQPMKLSNDTAKAVPTKQFFVSMLTRDISLDDAILDLIDNCLDGALRLADGGEVEYGKHFVRITFSEDQFSIEDNCGGIPRDVAIKYAFKMGREADDTRDADTETIGMYGVGMKRALFKMGTDALVKTRHGQDTFEVHIDSDWLDDKEWSELPIKVPSNNTEKLSKPGTTILVKDLYPGVAKHFANAAFVNDVETAISHHFTVFLQRGLKIEINGKAVKAVHVEVLVSKRKDGPAPYVYQKTMDGVLVSITVGLNTSRQYDADDDDDDGDFAGQRNSATAGWTVLCNDRAVIVGDKNRLTGWGDGIPLYHDQFIVITGIIEFRAKDAKRLPVTTTKRALDTSSNVWLESLVKMKEGMRVWISYTNQWKNHPREDQASHWSDAKPMSLSKAIEAVSPRISTKKGSDVLEFNPRKVKGALPEPKGSTPSSRRIVFSRSFEEVRAVSKLLFDDANEKPGIVGDKCFEIQLVKANKKEA